MNKEDLNRYTETLTFKKNELTAYVENQIKQIDYPTAPSIPAQQPTPSHSSYWGVGIGVILLAIGIGTKTPVITVGGGVVTAAGLFAVNKKRNAKTQQPAPSINYYRISEKVSYQIQSIHTHVSDSWNAFLSDQQNSLKQLIEMSGFNADTKNKMIELSLNRSIIQCSIMDVLSDLNKVEKQKNIEAYKQYSNEFLGKYQKIIEEAYKEQKQRYEAIARLVQ